MQGKLTFHLSPPWIAPRDSHTGLPRKIAVPGAVAIPLFKTLRQLRFLRDTPFDPFRYSGERQQDREFLALYTSDLDRLAALMEHGLSEAQHAAAIEIAQLPGMVRGYGHVR
ncbi:hypothetical protein T484DRAFT_1820436 [Baffinella frigidus]|nr:hypothetical protein T484DRAFT_1820436 [Cryptophyta sp. CCMP2293]